MKKTNKAWLFFSLQLVFMLLVPILLIWLQYGDLEGMYKVSMTGILCTILIFWVFKKIMLDKWLKGLDQKIVNIETNSLSITDKTAIESNKKAWRTYTLLQLLINSIIPLLLLVFALVTIKTLEQGLIKLFGCMMFCTISVGIGVIFKVAEIYSVKLTHESD